jgi:hypothetical protein
VKKPDRKVVAVLGLLVGAVCSAGLAPRAQDRLPGKQGFAMKHPEGRALNSAPEGKLTSTGEF